MKSTRIALLGSTATLVTIAAAHAADLPVAKAAPIEYVRVCSAYGNGFFYIPGTDTCLRLSGRARFEGGYMTSYSRQYGNGGDSSGFQGRLRINLDARTQTAYGTLRAFARLDAGARTGYSGLGTSGSIQRNGQAFPGLGVDQFGRDQQMVNVDKAFIQFAGITAGRASSFFDFYAHDFELSAYTLGSDVYSTNLLAYTAKFEDGFSATLSIEDPVFRRTPIFSPTINSANVTVNAAVANFGLTFSPAPVFVGYTNGVPTRYNNVDAIERERLPDFVGVARLDQAWGSAQLSVASHELNIGNINVPALSVGTGPNNSIPHANSVLGWGAQAGIKINLPFVSVGDAFYLQGAYANGAQLYTGYSSATSYTQALAVIQGQKFTPFYSDAVVNPYTGQLQTSTSFSVVASYLHYWSPEWRSAFFASYGQLSFGRGIRAAQGAAYTLANPIGTNNFASNAIGTPGSLFYNISEALRDTYSIVAGANLIWSPVKDLDIGVEGFLVQQGVRSGRVIDKDKDVTAYTAARIASINAGGPVRTATQDTAPQIRFRIQRDF